MKVEIRSYFAIVEHSHSNVGHFLLFNYYNILILASQYDHEYLLINTYLTIPFVAVVQSLSHV